MSKIIRRVHLLMGQRYLAKAVIPTIIIVGYDKKLLFYYQLFVRQ